MKRFYFHHSLGEATFPDESGACFSDEFEARAEAVPLAVEMLQEALRRSDGLAVMRPIEWRMWVVDDEDRTLCRVSFAVE